MALYARFAKDPCETRGKGSGKAPRSSAEDGELSRNTTFQEVRRISFRTDLLAKNWFDPADTALRAAIFVEGVAWCSPSSRHVSRSPRKARYSFSLSITLRSLRRISGCGTSRKCMARRATAREKQTERQVCANVFGLFAESGFSWP